MLHRNLNIYPMLQNIRTTEQTVEARATVCAAISPNAAKTDLPGRNRASYRPWPVSEITCNRPPCAECLFRHQHHAPQTPTSRSRAAPPRAPPEDKPGQGCPTPPHRRCLRLPCPESQATAIPVSGPCSIAWSCLRASCPWFRAQASRRRMPQPRISRHRVRK